MVSEVLNVESVFMTQSPLFISQCDIETVSNKMAFPEKNLLNFGNISSDQMIILHVFSIKIRMYPL